MEMPWRYSLGEVTQDRRLKRAFTQPGFCPLIQGADMRVQGGLTPFCGFKFIHRLGVGLATGETGYTITSMSTGDFWPVTLQVESGSSVSGYVYRCTVSGVVEIRFEYYDGIGVDVDAGGGALSGTGWRTVVLVSGAGTAQMDVVVFGRLLYVFRKGSEAVLFYIYSNGGSLTEKLVTDTGPGPAPPLLAANVVKVTPTGSQAVLDAGKYSFGYRLKDSKTGRISQLSQIVDVKDEFFGAQRTYPLGGTGPGEPCAGAGPGFDPTTLPACPFEYRRPTSGMRIDVPLIASISGLAGKYDQVELYRSIRIEAAGTTFAGTVLYKDGTETLSTSGLTPHTYALNDLPLTIKDAYNNKAEFDEDMPKAGAAGILNGTLFTGPDGASTAPLANVGEMRWSSLSDVCVELFPPDNRSVPEQVRDEVIRFVKAGDMFVGFSRSRHYFVLKAGTTVAVREMHEGSGLTGPRAACAVGPLIYLNTPQGFVELDGAGNLRSITAIDELIMGDWAADVGELIAVYDPPMGCLMLLNPTTEETVCFWITTRSVCQQAHTNFKGAGTGLVPNGTGVNANQPRAQFVTNGGQVMRVDDRREKRTPTNAVRTTQFEVDGTHVNVVAASASGTTVVVNGAFSIGTTPSTDVASLRDAKIYWTSGVNRGTAQTISSVSGLTITLATALPATGAAGDTFVISPVVFKCRMWPLQQVGEDGKLLGNDLFARKIIRAVGCVWGGVGGSGGGDERGKVEVEGVQGVGDDGGGGGGAPQSQHGGVADNGEHHGGGQSGVCAAEYEYERAGGSERGVPAAGGGGGGGGPELDAAGGDGEREH